MMLRSLPVTICLLLHALLAAADPPASDGWLGSETSLRLEQTDPVATLVVRGLIPGLGPSPFVQDIVVLLDGQEVLRQRLNAGEFEVRAISTASGSRLATIRLAELRPLPSPDRRTVGCRLTHIGFEGVRPAPTAWRPASDHRDIVPAHGPIGLGSGWYPYETYQGESFRWMSGAAELAIPPGQELPLLVTAEPGPQRGSQPHALRIVDRKGRLIDRIEIGTKGAFQIIIPPLQLDELPLQLILSLGQIPIEPTPGDGRVLGLRVLSIAVRP